LNKCNNQRKTYCLFHCFIDLNSNFQLVFSNTGMFRIRLPISKRQFSSKGTDRTLYYNNNDLVIKLGYLAAGAQAFMWFSFAQLSYSHLSDSKGEKEENGSERRLVAGCCAAAALIMPTIVHLYAGSKVKVGILTAEDSFAAKQECMDTELEAGFWTTKSCSSFI
jgi:TMEM70/TMEM186/TMEM223 protein family